MKNTQFPTNFTTPSGPTPRNSYLCAGIPRALGYKFQIQIYDFIRLLSTYIILQIMYELDKNFCWHLLPLPK